MGSYRLVKMLNPISITVNGTFTPKGAYNGATSYSVGDQVDYNGTSYILYSAASAGTLPTDNTKWGVLASKGDQGIQGIPGTPGTPGADGADGADGTNGTNGLPGADGADGVDGTNGQGVPVGGTAGQQLAKINGTDYNTQWVNPVDISGKADTTTLTAHTSNTSNPHSVTKAQVGLGSVPDTDFTSAIAAKQDTLVSGTNIKTINSTSILGSGDIVIGGAVDSVNTQTGVVVLDTDDIAEGTNKYVTSAEKTILSNTSGVNTGDQDISGIATNASNITNKVSKAGDTMTGNLYIEGGDTTEFIVGNAGATYNDYIQTFRAVKEYKVEWLWGSRTAPDSFLALSLNLGNNYWDNKVRDFIMQSTAASNSLFVKASNGYVGIGTATPSERLTINGNASPSANVTNNLGTSSAYWLNTYTQKLYLNSTASLDGSTAGVAKLTGVLSVNGVTAINVPSSTSIFFGSGGTSETGGYNVGIGRFAMDSVTSGNYNLAVGADSMKNTITGSYNVAIGPASMKNAVGIGNSVGVGQAALEAMTSGGASVAIGQGALAAATSCGNNVAIGWAAGRYYGSGSSANTSATDSIYVGYGSRSSAVGQTNQIVIGKNLVGNGSNTVTIGNSSNTANYFTGTVNTTSDVEITDTTKGVILKSPDGTRWRITIDNTGALNSTSI